MWEPANAEVTELGNLVTKKGLAQNHIWYRPEKEVKGGMEGAARMALT